jgi:Protein of unknown function (DUF3187)
MARTYGVTRSLVKAGLSYRVPHRMRPILFSMAVSLLAAGHARGQGLPELAPLNPMSSSRSGLYFQPYQAPAPGRWVAALALDYASVIEYNRLSQADYVLDSELLRINLGLARDLGPRVFLLLDASVGGAYAGFMDGFLDWYHGALGIEVSERARRPRDGFLYQVTLPDGSSVSRSRSDLFLGDIRAGLGRRHNSWLQSVLSLTLPTATGPGGYGRGVPALGLLNTVRAHPRSGWIYEGSLSLGFTPAHGRLPEQQRELFVAASSGMRMRVWGPHSVFANLFYHSPYYSGTTLPALDRRELSLDLGWILHTRTAGEWRIGITEDLEPGGPGVDLVLRFGRSF